MNTKTILLRIACTAAIFLLAPVDLLSQNTAVRWFAVDVGFATSTLSGTTIKSGIGQTLAGTSRQANVNIESGFLAHELLRKLGPSLADDGTGMPLEFSLSQNYPNPFNPRTSFQFQVPSFELVSIKVFDVLGREVAALVNEIRAPGVYRVSWDASALPSGMYLCCMQAGEFNAVMKTILLK